MEPNQVRSLICIWILFALSSIVMILRIISQFKILHIVRADDILMIIAWILQTVKAALVTVCIYWGLGLHDWQMPNRYDFVMVMKYEMYTMLFGTLCGLFGRLAFAAFLLYFMQRVSRMRTYTVWAVIVVQIVVTIVLLVIEMVRCAPAVAKPHAAVESANCWTSESMLAAQYSHGAIDAACNLCLTILALSLVVSIHAPGYAKTGLGILLSFSLLATISNILDIVEVHQSRAVGDDYTYRLNTWNYWYSIENAVIIITASMPKLRPVFIVVYRRLKASRTVGKLKRWSNSKGPTSLRFRFLRLSGTHNSTNSRRSSPSRPSPPSIRGQAVTDEEEASPPSMLQKLKSGNSIYSKKSRCNNNNNSSINSSSRRNNYWHKSNNHHRRHLSSGSGGTFSLSSIPRSSHSAAGAWDSKDMASFDQASSIISRDFVPVSSPRLAYQTVISAGDPSVPPPPPPLPPPFINIPAPVAIAVTPTGLSTPNGGSSGRTSRSSRREQQDGFATSNSSFIFLPATINNNNNNNNSNSGTPGLFPILQTNYFSIEYEDANHNNNNITNHAPDICWNARNNVSDPHHRNRSESSRRHQRRRPDVELGWATMRHHDHQEDMNSNVYNEDDANALQLHDVGSILKDSEGNRH